MCNYQHWSIQGKCKYVVKRGIQSPRAERRIHQLILTLFAVLCRRFIYVSFRIALRTHFAG